MLANARALFFSAVTVWLCSCIGISAAAPDRHTGTSNVPSFDWSSIEPSVDLIWHDCYVPAIAESSVQQVLSSPSLPKLRRYSCARLSRSREYDTNTTASDGTRTVTVPVLRISSPPSLMHRGTIFLAFGGAGNSRIQDTVAIASRSDFLDWIDPDFEYDFITFDNRGFGYSSPSAKCFDSLLEGASWEERMADLGGVLSTGDTDEGLGVRLAAAKAKGELCASRDGGDGDIRRHMTTAYAARDMLEIFLRHTEHLSQTSSFSSGQSQNGELPKMKFLGLSYGTILGQTFASLYPEYVSRMILDGSVNGKDWTGRWQMQHLIDADAIWASFFEDCFGASQACPLWRSHDSDPTDIANRINALLRHLKYEPMYTVQDGNARLITHRDVRLAIYWMTMAPGLAAPVLASILNDLINGSTNVTLEFPFNVESRPSPSNCPSEEDEDMRAGSNADAGAALNCGDAEDINNSTAAEFEEYLARLENQSSTMAFFQAERRVRCMGWRIKPAWRFTGPFSSNRENDNEERREDGEKRSTPPILFIGNTLDPMTSLRNAYAAAEGFPGSVVLEQKGRGHCALIGANGPSACLLNHLRSYLHDGDLPEKGTVCGIGEDCNFFDGDCRSGGDKEGVSGGVREKRRAGRMLVAALRG